MQFGLIGTGKVSVIASGPPVKSKKKPVNASAPPPPRKEDDEVAPVPGHIKAIRNEIRKNLNRPIHTEKENQFAHLKEAFENVAQKLGGNAEEDEKTSEPVNV